MNKKQQARIKTALGVKLLHLWALMIRPGYWPRSLLTHSVSLTPVSTEREALSIYEIRSSQNPLYLICTYSFSMSETAASVFTCACVIGIHLDYILFLASPLLATK